MAKRNLLALVLPTALLLYLLAWPVPIDPVSWSAPANPGFSGAFAPNNGLEDLEVLNIGTHHGPEDVAVDHQGRLYSGTHDGWIVRLDAKGQSPQNWVNTGGRPLGLDFDQQGNLLVADAIRGLLSISPAGNVREVATEVDGLKIQYVDDVAVAKNGMVYFSDASSKFGAAQWGTYRASFLDVIEHGGHGRLLVWDPQSKHVTVLLEDLNFANGVTLSHDQRYILVNETGHYRTLRHWLEGEKTGQTEVFVQHLPGFPDNISRGEKGVFWLALFAPRNSALDNLSDKPWLRRIYARLPQFLHPKPKIYGHVIALDENGDIIQSFQQPTGRYPTTTSVTETANYLYIGSLSANGLGRLNKPKLILKQKQ